MEEFFLPRILLPFFRLKKEVAEGNVMSQTIQNQLITTTFMCLLTWLLFIFDNRLKNESKNACPVNSLRSDNTGRPPALVVGNNDFNSKHLPLSPMFRIRVKSQLPLQQFSYSPLKHLLLAICRQKQGGSRSTMRNSSF